jgi:hypothetical protein
MNAVLDIEPTSQYGLDRDLTSINSTICFRNPGSEPVFLTLLAPSDTETECNVRRQSHERPEHQVAQPLDREQYSAARDALTSAALSTAELDEILAKSTKQFSATITIAPGQQVVRFHTRIPIRADNEGVYTCTISAPMGASARLADRPLSIMALLPNESPDFEVEVLQWSQGSPSNTYGFVGAGVVAGRPLLSWLWRDAPFVCFAYRYNRHR